MQTFRPGDIRIAASLLTRLPLRVDHAAVGARVAAAGWAWPVVGAGVGALIGATLLAAQALAAPPLMAAALALAAGLVTTGALHEDGLADCADGVGGGQTRERRLEIMRDSRHGTFGVAALALALTGRIALLAALPGGAALASCVAAGALSRAPLPLMLRAGPPASPGGLAAGVGRPAVATVVAALATGAVLGWVAVGPAALAALAAASATAALVHWAARRTLGGVTGDVLGAAQCLGEIAALWALLAAFSA
jgi:adenosylcobinamide-GDP ribazoletransferase